jgi:Ca-activated chloride channel family protein
MRLAEPWLLTLLLLPAALALRLWIGRRGAPRHFLALSTLAWLDRLPSGRRERWRARLPALQVAGLALLLGALARPQLPGDVQEVTLRSRNIMVALDISSSMKATDFREGSRIEVARRLLAEFVRRRDDDMIGLVTFAGRAFLQAPLNADTALLARTLEQVDIGQISDGTAIGTALALSLDQLKNLPPKASVILLVTDGANNTGQPTPAVAAEAARALGIRVHAIGLSSLDTAGVMLNGVWKLGGTAARLSRWDEALLQRITERTGGVYYRASDPAGLDSVLARIDQAERVPVKVPETRQYRELYPLLLAPGLLLLCLEFGLGLTWLRSPV